MEEKLEHTTENEPDARHTMQEFFATCGDECEQFMMDQVLLANGFTRLNKLMSYGKSINGDIHLHIIPNKKTPLGEKIRLMREGFKELAQIVAHDATVTQITATSWIVAEAPELMRMLGFGPSVGITDDIKRAYFSKETRPVHRATMSREVLLERYLDKK